MNKLQKGFCIGALCLATAVGGSIGGYKVGRHTAKPKEVRVFLPDNEHEHGYLGMATVKDNLGKIHGLIHNDYDSPKEELHGVNRTYVTQE